MLFPKPNPSLLTTGYLYPKFSIYPYSLFSLPPSLFLSAVITMFVQ